MRWEACQSLFGQIPDSETQESEFPLSSLAPQHTRVPSRGQALSFNILIFLFVHPSRKHLLTLLCAEHWVSQEFPFTKQSLSRGVSCLVEKANIEKGVRLPTTISAKARGRACGRDLTGPLIPSGARSQRKGRLTEILLPAGPGDQAFCPRAHPGARYCRASPFRSLSSALLFA